MVRRFDPRAFLAKIGDGKTVTAYRQGAVIFEQGAEADTVFYLQSGRAKETSASPHGKDAVLRVLEPGLFFGASNLFGGSRLTTVTALTPCIVTGIGNHTMVRALRQPAFGRMFVNYLLEHSAQIENEKIDLLLNTVERRLAHKLLLLARLGEGEPQIIGPEVTQEMLGNMIGATRPHVNYYLNKFRKLGFIRYNGGIMVQPALLKAVLQEIPEKERQ